MEKSLSVVEIAKALSGFQSAVGKVSKSATNPFFKKKYAPLDGVIDEIKPHLAKHGLSFAQFVDGQALTTILLHTSGEWMQATADLVIKEQTPQGQGAAIGLLPVRWTPR